MNAPLLLSIQVGLPRQLGVEGAPDPMDRPWSTGFFKDPVQDQVWLGQTNLVGDGQADLKNHGGPDKAVLAYSADHYPAWRRELDRPDLPYGAFGENFTIAGLSEDEVCIGDRYAIGEARVQVSQPRQPCWKLARRWRIKDLTAQVERTGRTGWYFRVLTEGYVEPGLAVILLDRPFPQWTVTRASEIMRRSRDDPAAAVELAACPLLSAGWQQTLTARAFMGTGPDPQARLRGPDA